MGEGLVKDTVIRYDDVIVVGAIQKYKMERRRR
jgi:hypothetical protein